MKLIRYCQTQFALYMNHNTLQFFATDATKNHQTANQAQLFGPYDFHQTAFFGMSIGDEWHSLQDK